MENFKAHKVTLQKFLKSPAARGYFVPQSQLRKNSIKKNCEIKKLRYTPFETPRFNFNYIENSSPKYCRIIRLSPLGKGKSERIINSHDSSVSRVMSKKKILDKDSTRDSPDVIYNELKPRIYLPSIKYTY